MHITFSTPWDAIASECGTKFPTYSNMEATKQLLFARLRGAGVTPVRYLESSGNDTLYTLLLDVPKVDNVDEIDVEMLPFVCS